MAVVVIEPVVVGYVVLLVIVPRPVKVVVVAIVPVWE
jgi:hypothetical protein